MKHLPTRSQAAKALLHQGTALFCRSKIPTTTLLREASALRGGARPGEKNAADRTSAPSATPEDQTKHPKRRGEARSNQTLSDGRTDNSNPQRPLLSEALEEGKA
ncbi:unnamed protein product [Sphagnum balticum]